MSEEEKKAYEEAKLYLEHTGVDDFNLEKHQCENRKWAIETILKIVEKQQKEIKKLTRLNSAYKTNYDSKVLKEERKNKKILEGYISKYKIREKIKELEEDIEIHNIYEENWNKINVLKELLEE